LLFADPRSGLVAAVHAGWRGTVAGVVAETVEALARLGVRPEEIIVAIGPMIERCCFEVGEDVAQTIAAAGSVGESVIDRGYAKPHVDLRAVLVAQLGALDVSNITHVSGCTQCRPDTFHSYRRDGKSGGRMLSAIVPRA
jgi:YfiH family protein